MIKVKILALSVIAILSTLFVASLYVTSEDLMHKENPFQRRYIKGSATLTKQLELHNQTLYFVGTNGSEIFIGDTRAPLQIFAFDTLSLTKVHYTIKLEDENFPFSRIQVKISGPNFYVLDGTVPIIFKGKIKDWQAKVVLNKSEAYFLNAEILDSNTVIFKRYLPNIHTTTIGQFDLANLGFEKVAPQKILESQTDGIFDVDGIMRVDHIKKLFVHLYYYRNQFSVTDRDLNLITRGKTIDTNSVVTMKVSLDNKTGKSQPASPTNIVNRLVEVHNEIMFVNSNVPGKNENMEMWEKASIIDVYDLRDQTYLSSFYVHNIMQSKIRDMLLVNNNLYVLVGNQINQYRLNSKFIRK